MAVPLVYKSCLNVDSFQKACDDLNTYNDAKAKQEEERAEHEAQQAALKADAEAAGTEFIPEERSWEEIVLPPIKTEDKKYVVCLDTMGQDRIFTEDERKFILETIYRFRCNWEEFERVKLELDRAAHKEEKQKDDEIITEDFLIA